MIHPGDLKPVKSDVNVNYFSSITTLYIPLRHSSTHRRNDIPFPFLFLTLYRKYQKEMKGFKTDINREAGCTMKYAFIVHNGHST